MLERLTVWATLGAMVVLSGAAVWMGALNQDEGWYLYAANMVGDGYVPYRDFFYTQGPLLPLVYSAFTGIWNAFGLLGARVFTLALGMVGIAFFAATAYRLAERGDGEGRGKVAMLVALMLLGTNLYHLYYLAIPKTYALGAVFVAIGFYALTFGRLTWAAGFALALASGARISLGAMLPVVGLWLLWHREWRRAVGFAIGGAVALALVYGPFVMDERALAGLMAAQKYHAARGGFDLVWTVGSISRLVRWYLPMIVLVVLAVATWGSWRRSSLWSVVMLAFLAVFGVQMAAPFPYEDYQVPIMGLMAVAMAVWVAASPMAKCGKLAVLAMCMATSFGSPLLEKWSVNGQDRFWALKKTKTELAQLREVAREIEALDPGGKEIFTQDLYLAIETGRKVPRGMEMGPFTMMTDREWRELLAKVDCPIAALSGYSFAIDPPVCKERPVKDQMEYWAILKQRYALELREENFGQNATTLLVLKRK